MVVSSIVHHIHTIEPDLTYEIVLAAPRNGSKGKAGEEWSKLYEKEFPLDKIQYFDYPHRDQLYPSRSSTLTPKLQQMKQEQRTLKKQRKEEPMEYESLETYLPSTPAEVRDILLNEMCSADYILSLEDNWEKRIGFIEGEAVTRVSNLKLLSLAIELLEKEKNVLEVWLGDVPNVKEYNGTRSVWKSVSHLNVSEDNVGADGLKYRIQDKSSTYPLGVTRFGGTLKHKKRLSLVEPYVSIMNSLSEGASVLDREMAYASAVARLGLKSAHFCLGDSMDKKSSVQCDLDPEKIGDGATTGMFWKIRLDEKGSDYSKLFDRM